MKTVNRNLSIVPFVPTLYLSDPVNGKIGLFTVYQFPARTLRVGDDEEKLVSFAWRMTRKLPRWRQPRAAASKRLALLVYEGGTTYWPRVTILNGFFFAVGRQ